MYVLYCVRDCASIIHFYCCYLLLPAHCLVCSDNGHPRVPVPQSNNLELLFQSNNLQLLAEKIGTMQTEQRV